VFLFIVASFGCSIKQGFNYSGEQAQRSEEGAFDAKIREIEVVNQFGNVEIEIAETGGWKWDLTCWAKTKEQADEFCQMIELKKHTSGVTQSWNLSIPDEIHQLRGVKSNLKIRVPADTKVEIENRHGDTSVYGVKSLVRVDNAHGKVKLQDLAGECVAQNSHGTLNASNLGSAELTNKHGDIAVENVAGDLQVEGSHGHVEVAQVSGSTIIANQHGNVDVKKLSNSADLSTSLGTMNVAEVGGDTKLSNQHGKISVDGIEGKLNVTNSFGPVNVNANSPEVEIQNKNGLVELNLSNPNISTVVAKASFNDLKVTLPASLQARFNLKATFGKVDSEFSDGDGSNRVELTAEHGNISLKKGN